MNIGDLFMTLRIDAAEFQKSIGGISSMALGAIGIVGVAIAGLGVKAAMEWETAFLGVKKTVDASEEDFDILERQLRDLAGVIPLPATELAHLAETAGALGIKSGDIAEFVRITAMIGTTTDVSARQAATSLGQLSNILGLTGEDYEHFGSALVDLGNKGASTETQILEIATRAGGAADLIGIAAAETLGWSSAVANLGVEADVGGSTLQRFFLRVSELTSSEVGLGKLTALTGLAADEFLEMWKNDPTEALLGIIDALSGLDAAARLQALKDLGFNDIRLHRVLLGLAGDVDMVTESVNIGREAWDANAAMQVEFEKKASGVEAQLQLLFNDLHDIAITLGDVLLPHVRNFVALARDVVGGIANWIKENKGLVDTLTPILTILSGIMALKWGGNFVMALLGQLGLGGLGRTLALAIIPGATLAGTAAGTAQGTAHATGATGPGFLTRMVTGIMATQASLSASSSIVGRLAGMAMGAAFVVGLAAVAPMIEKAITPIAQGLGRTFFGMFGDEVKGLAHGTVFDTVFDGIHGMWDAIGDADPLQTGAPQAMGEIGRAGGEAVVPGIEEGILAGQPIPPELLVRQLTPALQAALAATRATGTATGEAWAQATLDAFRNGDWSAATEAVKTSMRATAIAGQEAILDVFRNGDWSAAADAARGVISALNRGLQESIPSAHTAWKNFVDGLGKELDPLDELAWLKGKLSGNRLAKGLASENPFARQNAEDIRDTIVTEIAALERLLGIEGAQAGDEFGDELGNAANQRNAENSGDDLGSSALAGANNQPWGNGGAHAAGAWTDGFIRGIGTKRIRTALDQLSQPFRGDSPPKVGPLRNIDKWGENIGSAWREGFEKGIGGITGVLAGLAAPGMGTLNMPVLRGNATMELHHTVDIKGDAANLDNRKVADYLNEGAAGFAWNLEHAMSAVTSG